MLWSVYILRCGDGTLYTGVAKDVDRRVRVHNSGKGAKYTRSRLPVEAVYREICGDKSAALKRELAIKNLERAEKLRLIERGCPDYPVPAAAAKAIEILNAAGYEAWLVGGCVHDMLMGRALGDIDMCTSATPDEMQEVFREFRTIATGLKHGTLTVIVEGEPIELTTYRVDGEYADNRHPEAVQFTRSLGEDLRRRDFTMNAIAYAPGPGIADPLGGRADLASGVIRAVGEPVQRFREDGLRILRALRFAARLGFEIEKETAAALRAERELLKNISAERVREELTKLICGEHAAGVLRDYVEVIGVVLPELMPMVGFDQRNKHHCYDVWEHTLHALEAIAPEPALRWAILLHDSGKPACFTQDSEGVGHFRGHPKKSAEIAGALLRRLRFDNRSREQITELVHHHDRPFIGNAKAVRRALNKLGEEGFYDNLALHRADNLAQHPDYLGRQEHYNAVEAIAREILAGDDCFTLGDLAVNGSDLMALGYKGREIGERLDALLDAVMDERVENEREKLLEMLRK